MPEGVGAASPLGIPRAGVSVFSGGRVGDTGTVSPADSSALSDVALEGA